MFSGALGIALVFAYTSFIGFEATVIYGEEARDPRRTVPKATYIALIGMGVFYSISAWLLTNSFRADSVVAEAGDDPESFAAKALRSQLGAISNDIMSVLIITSIFAAVLAFHNTLARYLFALGRQGLVWGRLGRTHRTRQSPHVACLVQAATATAVIGVFAVSGADPYGGLYVWATGLGAIGVIILQSVASVAVFVFFRRAECRQAGLAHRPRSGTEHARSPGSGRRQLEQLRAADRRSRCGRHGRNGGDAALRRAGGHGPGRLAAPA